MKFMINVTFLVKVSAKVQLQEIWTYIFFLQYVCALVVYTSELSVFIFLILFDCFFEMALFVLCTPFRWSSAICEHRAPSLLYQKQLVWTSSMWQPKWWWESLWMRPACPRWRNPSSLSTLLVSRWEGKLKWLFQAGNCVAGFLQSLFVLFNVEFL